MMEEHDFWCLVYAAAIAGGHSINMARVIADAAVDERAERWHGEEESSDQE